MEPTNEFFIAYLDAIDFTSECAIRNAQLSRTARAKAQADCEAFMAEVRENPTALDAILSNKSHAGHDFWLTRNYHGAGFWEWEMEGRADKATAEWLTQIAHAFGEQEPYLSRGKVELF